MVQIQADTLDLNSQDIMKDPASASGSSLLVVKNTFLQVEDHIPDHDPRSTGMRRSASDSDISTRRSEWSYSSGTGSSEAQSSLGDSSVVSSSFYRELSKDVQQQLSLQQQSQPLEAENLGPGNPSVGCEPANIQFLINSLHYELDEPLSVLESLSAHGLLQQIPRNEQGEFTSVGSIGHISAEQPGGDNSPCKPCVFWFKNRCSKGVRCRHCHFRHPGQKSKKIRASKQTRALRQESQPDQQDASGGYKEEEMRITEKSESEQEGTLSSDAKAGKGKHSPRKGSIISL
jgi:hypothetical protein